MLKSLVRKNWWTFEKRAEVDKEAIMEYLDVCCRQRINSANVQVPLHFREKARRIVWL